MGADLKLFVSVDKIDDGSIFNRFQNITGGLPFKRSVTAADVK